MLRYRCNPTASRFAHIGGTVDPTLSTNRSGRLSNCAAPLVMVLCLPCIGAGQSQPQEPGAAAIIADLLNHQPGFNGGSFSCGWGYPEALESRKVADSLAKLGDSAVPDIERALDSIEQEGERSRFAPIASWLAYSYVKIKGPSAYPRLRTMIGDSKLDFLQYALSNCLSAAFGLTSYVQLLSAS